MTLATYSTKAPETIFDFLADVSQLFSGIERQLYREIQNQKPLKKLKEDYQLLYGINARQFNQKKRKLHRLEAKLNYLKSHRPKLIFGSRKLWNAQFDLESNGYASHEEWLKDWQSLIDKYQAHPHYQIINRTAKIVIKIQGR
jgi:hypothetical protein